jgi:hypothetical protein
VWKCDTEILEVVKVSLKASILLLHLSLTWKNNSIYLSMFSLGQAKAQSSLDEFISPYPIAIAISSGDMHGYALSM